MKKTASWTCFIIAGGVMFILLGLHITIVHLSGVVGWYNPTPGDAVLWENVIYRSHNLFFTIIYIILLGAVLYHAFYGLRTIISELGIKPSTERGFTIFLWIIGVLLFTLGTYAAVAVRTVG
jgi:succinate dehydrogenase/fumarate reductase cytochrome b subunit